MALLRYPSIQLGPIGATVPPARKELTMASELTGGFIGDVQDAFTPPAAGGCCGSATTATATSADTAVSCCGSQAEASQAAEAGCCGQAPTASAPPAGTSAGCCG